MNLCCGLAASRTFPVRCKGPSLAVKRRERLRPTSLGAHAAQAAAPGNRDKAVGVQAGPIVRLA